MNTIKKWHLFLLAFTTLLMTQSANIVEAESLTNQDEVKSFVDTHMEKDLDKYHIPGAVIAIVKDDEILYSKGYGMADISKDKKVDADKSMFRIASTTKLFTWTAVMQLVEAGKIDLDTDINTYLTSFKVPNTFDKPITMRDLMTHTAGFEEGGVGYQITTDTKRLNTTIAETLEKHALARVRPPGEKASYSNYGAALAGLIVEDVSGLSYTDYIQENIFNTLDMKHATLAEPLPKKYKDNEVIGYNYTNEKFTPGIPTYEGGFSPAGAGTVSANDMAKFMLAHLNNGTTQGKRLLDKKTTNTMHQTAFRFDKRLPGSALGFQEGEINGKKTLSHAGADTMFITDLYLVPEENIGIFLSYSGGQADDALASMKKHIFDYLFPITKKESPTFIPSTKEELANFTGSYKFTRRNYSHIDKFFSLLVEMKVAQENGQLVIGQGNEKEYFKKIDTNLFQQVDGQQKISFKTDKSGKATDMLLSIMPDMPLEKTTFWDQSSVWLILLAISIAIFIIVTIILLIQLKRNKKISHHSKQTIWLTIITAIISILTLGLTVTNVLNMDVLQRLSEVTLALKLFLFLPLFVGGLTCILLVRNGMDWFKKESSLVIRILTTTVFLAALTTSLFFIHWNLMGWLFG
ncbi:serine hydrolase domain-containing protein [Vagococcus hydrophili]|uniref:Beta-lactamase family protein n=1 Tax=Vagococcus hydrophili TaxID=2714947 RepID=A0A6G8ASH3_9ENTE|nr:serine hydrolase domain-containing protein [Vagococcus hydrophili]QIL47875.1 beta-lactamase family protein [Vagococcus hydrophili]